MAPSSLPLLTVVIPKQSPDCLRIILTVDEILVSDVLLSAHYLLAVIAQGSLSAFAREPMRPVPRNQCKQYKHASEVAQFGPRRRETSGALLF